MMSKFNYVLAALIFFVIDAPFAHGHPIHDAIDVGDTARVALLIKQDKACVHMRDASDIPPLHLAVWNNQADIVELLLEEGAGVNSQDGQARTPLFLAARQGHEILVAFLISRNAHVNAQDGNCGTPLHYAASWGKVSVAKILLDNGAGVNAKDVFGETPLSSARRGKNSAMVEFLIAQGAIETSASVAMREWLLNRVILDEDSYLNSAAAWVSDERNQGCAIL